MKDSIRKFAKTITAFAVLASASMATADIEASAVREAPGYAPISFGDFTLPEATSLQGTRRFKPSFGLERSGAAIIDLFKDDRASGVAPYIQFRYGDPYGLDLVARASINLWQSSFTDFPLEPSDISNPVLSDIRLYRQDRFTIDRLYTSYSFNPIESLYGRVAIGLLQTQYVGAQVEFLYAPSNSPFAIGAEIAQVQKRNPDELFEGLDYQVTTGHITAYYDTGFPGFLVSAAYGTYLAGDEGGTITVAKRFNNGWEVRGELTATEYYFNAEENKNDYLVPRIAVYIPLGLIGREGRFSFDKFVSSSTDAGRRLSISSSLYDDLRDYNAKGYSERWGGL